MRRMVNYIGELNAVRISPGRNYNNNNKAHGVHCAVGKPVEIGELPVNFFLIYWTLRTPSILIYFQHIPENIKHAILKEG